MKRNYVQVAQFLQSKFPGLKVIGDIYPAPPVAEFLSNILKITQMIGIAWMMMGGDKLLRMVGFRTTLPNFYYTIEENPIPVAIFIFLLGPQIVQQFSNNGAFEIILDDNIEIYSKITKGVMPNADDLIKPLQNAGLIIAQES